MMKWKRISLPASILLAGMFISGCAGESRTGEMIRETRDGLLGTVITVSTYEAVDREVLEGVFTGVADIDARMTMNTADSEIAKVNAASGKTAVAVSDDTYALVKWAEDFSEEAGGAFDVSIGAVTDLWKQDGAFAVLPEHAAVEEKLQVTNCGRIDLSQAGEIYLDTAGMMLDLGGIAKGYACDEALKYLKSRGLAAGLLDFGGNIYAYGLKPDGSPWRIGVEVPLQGESGSACAVSISDMAVVTSGGYERYFEADGTTYHHILDPATGYPVDNELLSVTLVDPQATRADALSTACFVLGLDEGMALLETLEDSEGIFITKDYEIYVTAGLEDKVTVVDERFIKCSDQIN